MLLCITSAIQEVAFQHHGSVMDTRTVQIVLMNYHLCVKFILLILKFCMSHHNTLIIPFLNVTEVQGMIITLVPTTFVITIRTVPQGWMSGVLTAPL